MASRIATSLRSSAASILRPHARLASRAFNTTALRSERKSPADRASEIIEKVPSSPGLITKTGAVVLGTGALATAISQELYVVNEETIVLVGTMIMLGVIIKAVKEPYAEWAKAQIEKITSVLETARAQHTQSVQERIDSVGQMKDVVDITKGLFTLSKETAQLEAENFTLRQQVSLAAEWKAVLDSWARYEQQAKESEQVELSKTVIDKVFKNLQDERTQREILANAIAEVEQLVKAKAI